MQIDYSGIFMNGFLQGFIPILKVLIAPLILWIFIPGMVTQVLFKSRQAYSIGAFMGLIALFTLGPFSSN